MTSNESNIVYAFGLSSEAVDFHTKRFDSTHNLDNSNSKNYWSYVVGFNLSRLRSIELHVRNSRSLNFPLNLDYQTEIHEYLSKELPRELTLIRNHCGIAYVSKLEVKLNSCRNLVYPLRIQ